MLNPAESDTTREIKITYVTDSTGEMEINIESEGFEGNDRFIPLYLLATLEALKAGSKE